MAEALYTIELDSPLLIEQGRANLLRFPARRDGALIAPSAGTITIVDGAGTTQVSAAAVSITAGAAQYTTGTFSSATRGEDWRVSVALTMPDGAVHTARTTAALVRCIPQPLVSDRRIATRVSALDPANPACITQKASYQDVIDSTWREISRMLQKRGDRPWLVISSGDLEEAHLLLCLVRIFEDLGFYRPEYTPIAEQYRRALNKEWASLSFVYDKDDDGEPEPGRRGGGVVWLGAGGLWQG